MKSCSDRHLFERISEGKSKLTSFLQEIPPTHGYIYREGGEVAHKRFTGVSAYGK